MQRYKTFYDFYEENVNGDFNNVEPHEYSVLTLGVPTAETDLDILFECLEIERLGCKHIMVEKTVIDENGEYVDSDTAIIEIICIVHTEDLSSYINWKVAKGLPPIYAIDREKSKIKIDNL